MRIHEMYVVREIIGSVIPVNVCQLLAPSTFAAS
jgi:hypothetical protein